MRKPHDGSSTQAGLGSRINNAILGSLPAAKYTHGAHHVARRLPQDGVLGHEAVWGLQQGGRLHTGQRGLAYSNSSGNAHTGPGPPAGRVGRLTRS